MRHSLLLVVSVLLVCNKQPVANDEAYDVQTKEGRRQAASMQPARAQTNGHGDWTQSFGASYSTSFAISPDGKRMLALGSPFRFSWWDLDSGKEIPFPAAPSGVGLDDIGFHDSDIRGGLNA